MRVQLPLPGVGGRPVQGLDTGPCDSTDVTQRLGPGTSEPALLLGLDAGDSPKGSAQRGAVPAGNVRYQGSLGPCRYRAADGQQPAHVGTHREAVRR
jgi:hypothetical protein